MLRFDICLSDVFAHNSQSCEVRSAAKENRRDYPASSSDGNSENQKNQENEHREKGGAGNEKPAEKNHINGARAERGNSVPGKVEHFFDRVFAFARKAGTALVINDAVFEPKHRHHSPKEEVDLAELLKRLNSPFAHKTEVRVVENYVRAEKFHNAVIPLGGKAF